ncbi:alpha/beta fold hydrolase [Streptomyces sp. Z26]|uniref:alpha/beta fold hydrolase n=1 Tax=Streptomyces sp. Z26 TaxID=2500177 RepID=UPI000EF156E1|nr:alpha/beta fold hydrolase [Streptomyces sp. Z26]RLL67573.1 alpha/beta fold hydrolase [Streptomyces sp. Z26]
MTEFVLVAGAWLGAWAWDDVVPELRAAGHGAHPVTLSGVAERRDVAAGQRTHVEDVVAVVEQHDLRDVVLVGHSYSGIPVGQAAERVGDRLAHLVLLDSDVPVDGGSFVSELPHVAEAVAAHGGSWPPPAAADLAGQDLDDERVARVLARCTPHPGASLTEPAVLTGALGGLPTTYVKCLLDGPAPTESVARLLAGDRWRLVEMDTGHWPMFSRPRELARVLLTAAATGRA